MPKKSRSKRYSRNRRCQYGVKKSGGCKKKSGRKPGMVRRKSRKRSRRRNRRCQYGVKKSGGCKKKSGRKPSRSRRKSRRRSRRKSRSRSRRKSRVRKRSYMTSPRCKSALKEKIRENMREYNNGRYANRKQAIAVAYSQINKKYHQCKDKI
jgi:hypothetical protein